MRRSSASHDSDAEQAPSHSPDRRGRRADPCHERVRISRRSANGRHGEFARLLSLLGQGQAHEVREVATTWLELAAPPEVAIALIVEAEVALASGDERWCSRTRGLGAASTALPLRLGLVYLKLGLKSQARGLLEVASRGPVRDAWSHAAHLLIRKWESGDRGRTDPPRYRLRALAGWGDEGIDSRIRQLSEPPVSWGG